MTNILLNRHYTNNRKFPHKKTSLWAICLMLEILCSGPTYSQSKNAVRQNSYSILGIYFLATWNTSEAINSLLLINCFCHSIFILKLLWQLHDNLISKNTLKGAENYYKSSWMLDTFVFFTSVLLPFSSYTNGMSIHKSWNLLWMETRRA